MLPTGSGSKLDHLTTLQAAQRTARYVGLALPTVAGVAAWAQRQRDGLHRTGCADDLGANLGAALALRLHQTAIRQPWIADMTPSTHADVGALVTSIGCSRWSRCRVSALEAYVA
jgi:hypothetical protein